MLKSDIIWNDTPISTSKNSTSLLKNSYPKSIGNIKIYGNKSKKPNKNQLIIISFSYSNTI